MLLRVVINYYQTEMYKERNQTITLHEGVRKKMFTLIGSCVLM